MADTKNNGAESKQSSETVLDTIGLFCPEPVMLLHSKVDEVEEGTVIEVRATDPSTKRDIPKFCQFLGHELISKKENDDLFVYLIRKG